MSHYNNEFNKRHESLVLKATLCCVVHNTMEVTGNTFNVTSETAVCRWWLGGRGGSLVGCGSEVHYVWSDRFVVVFCRTAILCPHKLYSVTWKVIRAGSTNRGRWLYQGPLRVVKNSRAVGIHGRACLWRNAIQFRKKKLALLPVEYQNQICTFLWTSRHMTARNVAEVERNSQKRKAARCVRCVDKTSQTKAFWGGQHWYKLSSNLDRTQVRGSNKRGRYGYFIYFISNVEN